MERGALRRTVLVRFGGGAVVLGAILFLSAGTLRWWEAWVYLGTLLVPMAFVAGYLYRNDPALLERRMMRNEERTQQRAIVWVSSVVWLVSFLFPAFDHRFGWSSVPAGLAVVGDGLVLAGYLIFFLTVRENSFAARVVQVEEGQRVISTGPYAVVRHPMYSGISLMWMATPVALGSWWGLIPALTTPLFLAVRLLDEEKALAAALPGYAEYTRRVRWRLVPRIW